MTLISQYDNIWEIKNGREMPLDLFFEYIKDGKWQDIVIPIRAIKDDKERSEAKKKALCVTLSGRFDERADNKIIAHSGFIGMDVDDVDPEEYKARICNDKYVYAAFASISGRGLCIVFKISGEKHREAFAGLSEYLYSNYNITCDPSSVNPSRARFISFDPHIFINEGAQKFANYPKAKAPKKIEKIVFAQNDFEEIIKEIQYKTINICENYQDWLRIGFALCDKFGEDGRAYFHVVSQFSSKYDVGQCDKQYTNCLKARNSGVTIATFYYYLKQAGIKIYSEKTKLIAHAAIQGKRGGLSEQQVVKNLQKFEDIKAEESQDIVSQVFVNDIEIDTEDSLFELVQQWIRYNYEFRRNVITRHIEDRGNVLQSKDFNTIYIQAKKIFSTLTFQDLERIINSSFTSDYNPIHEFFNQNKDRKPNGIIKKLWQTIETDNAEFLDRLGTKWLVGMVAGVYDAHNVLLLVLSEEKGNKGKTQFFRRLFPKDLKPYYAESKLDAGKDDEILMTQKMFVMDDEYGGKSKKEDNKMRDLLSKDTFTLREPYGRYNVDLKRIATLGGTTNYKNLIDNVDSNRRVIPINVISINHELYNSIDKIDLFIEAYHLYKSGFNFELTKEEIEILTNNIGEFENYTSEYELIPKFFKIPTGSHKEYLTTTDIKIELEKHTQQKLSLDKIGRAMKRHQYNRVSRSFAGKGSIKVYEVDRISQIFFPGATNGQDLFTEPETPKMQFQAEQNGQKWGKLPFE